MAAAQSSGNISALLNMLVGSSALTGDDYVEQSLGNMRAMYYMYLDNYHVKPRDLIELVDGILYLEAKTYIREQEMNRMERLRNEQRGN